MQYENIINYDLDNQRLNIKYLLSEHTKYSLVNNILQRMACLNPRRKITILQLTSSYLRYNFNWYQSRYIENHPAPPISQTYLFTRLCDRMTMKKGRVQIIDQTEYFGIILFSIWGRREGCLLSLFAKRPPGSKKVKLWTTNWESIVHQLKICFYCRISGRTPVSIEYSR